MDRRKFMARIVAAIAAIPVIGPKLARASGTVPGVPPLSERAQKAWDMLRSAPGMRATHLDRHRKSRGELVVDADVFWSGPLSQESVDSLMLDVATDVPEGFRLVSVEKTKPLFKAEGIRFVSPQLPSLHPTCCFGTGRLPPLPPKEPPQVPESPEPLMMMRYRSVLRLKEAV